MTPTGWPSLPGGGTPDQQPPRLLDAFCRKGGSSAGYIAAGWDVTGVDIEDHADGYPGTFVQGDAVEYILAHGAEYDAIHAGPPCQADCALTAGTNQARRGMHTSWLAATRAALDITGRPYVIEQPVGKAKIRRDLLLCGLMFPDLRVFRHRQFELGGWTTTGPRHPSHRGHRVAGYRHGVRYDGDMVAVYGDGGGKGSLSDWQAAMGIDWMTNRKDLAEAIPPAMTEFIGAALLAHLSAAAAA